MTYASPTKVAIRHQILRLALEDKCQVVYLESEDASATTFFLKNGLEKNQLFPVNMDADACKRVRKATGVQCNHADIDNYVKNTLVRTGNTVAWLDYTGNQVKPEVLDHCLMWCAVVMVTVTVQHAANVLDNTLCLCQKKGDVVHWMKYRGKSNVMNMLHVEVRPKK